MKQLLSRNFATLLPLMIALERILISGAEKGCKASTAFIGSSASITCYFDDNNARLKMNVFIEHLRFNASDHEIVTSCQLNEGRYKCSCIDGYRVVGTVTDFLTVEIPDALPKHAGQYWCGGFESHPLGRTHCKLSVTENLNLNGQRSHYRVSYTGNDDHEDQIKEEPNPSPTVFIIVAALMMFVVICIFTIVIVILWRRSGKKDSEENFDNKDNIKALLI